MTTRPTTPILALLTLLLVLASAGASSQDVTQDVAGDVTQDVAGDIASVPAADLVGRLERGRRQLAALEQQLEAERAGGQLVTLIEQRLDAFRTGPGADEALAAMNAAVEEVQRLVLRADRLAVLVATADRFADEVEAVGERLRREVEGADRAVSASNPLWTEQRRVMTAPLLLGLDTLDGEIRAFRAEAAATRRLLLTLPAGTVPDDARLDAVRGLSREAAELAGAPARAYGALRASVRAQRSLLVEPAVLAARLDAVRAQHERLLSEVTSRLERDEEGRALLLVALAALAAMLALLLLVPRLYPIEIQHSMVAGGLLGGLAIVFGLAGLLLFAALAGLQPLALAVPAVVAGYALGRLGAGAGPPPARALLTRESPPALHEQESAPAPTPGREALDAGRKTG